MASLASLGGFSIIAPVFLLIPEYCNVAPIIESMKLPKNPEIPPTKLKILYFYRRVSNKLIYKTILNTFKIIDLPTRIILT